MKAGPYGLPQRNIISEKRREALGCWVMSGVIVVLIMTFAVIMLATAYPKSVFRAVVGPLIMGESIAVPTYISSVFIGWGVRAIIHFGWRRAGWFWSFPFAGLMIACVALYVIYNNPPIMDGIAVTLGLGLGAAFLASAPRGYYWDYLEERYERKQGVPPRGKRP
jgi:hypothetical protein